VARGWTRWIVAPALAGAVAVAAALSGSGAERAGAQSAQNVLNRPNVLVLMSDDQTLESLRVMGNVRTLLGNQGVTFDNNFVSYSLCCPSRATLFTGQYAHNHHVMGNAPPNGGYDRLDHKNTLPVWLQKAGYVTIHLGKYLNGYGRVRQTEVPAGWSEWYGSIDPSTYQFYNYTLNENGRLVKYGATPADYQADVYGRKAVEIIRRQAADPRPFFFSVAFLAPHSGGPREPGDPANMATPVPAPRHRNAFATTPLPLPPSFNETDVSDKPSGIRTRPLLTQARINAIRENYQQRLESLLAVDEAVGEIVRALEATGELNRTYIIFTADNGFFHGEHRVPTGKVLLYEPSIRVPLIIRGPGIPRGGHRPQLAANIDLAPTIVAAARAAPERVMDGRSLLPIARDRLLFWGRDLLLETPTYSAIRTPRWKYAEHVNGEKELYDLLADPNELASHHNDPRYAGVQSALAERLLRLKGCTGLSCRRGVELTLAARYRRGRGGCTRSRVRLAVGGPAARAASQVQFYVDGRLVRRDGVRPFTALVPRRLIRRGGSAVNALVTLGDLRRQTVARTLRRC
jgi:N-acetylglucosamine-6-sulfatase